MDSIYLVSYVYWYRDEDENGQDIGWTYRIIENVKAFRNASKATEYRNKLVGNLGPDKTEDYYSYYSYTVQKIELA